MVMDFGRKSKMRKKQNKLPENAKNPPAGLYKGLKICYAIENFVDQIGEFEYTIV